MHRTEASKYGTVAAGAFDISRWPRPIELTHLIWPTVKELKVVSGEPSAYLQFMTDKKVVLKQFEPNQQIHQITSQLVDYKSFEAFQPLETLYTKFVRGNRHKALARLIKDSLLD
jgi:hypothetical protein